MKAFASAVLFTLAISAGTASAASPCIIEVTVDGFMDGKTCNVAPNSTVEVLTGYTQCHIPVTVDASCKIVASDLSVCDFKNVKLNSYSGNSCY